MIQCYRLMGRWVLPLCVAIVGCGSPEEIPLDELTLASINPLADNTQFPADNAESYQITSGTYETDKKQSWAQLKGYVHAPIGKVWEALRDRRVITDRNEIKAEDLGECPFVWQAKYDKCLVFHNINPDYPSSPFTYDITWSHRVLEGTSYYPTKVRIEYQKTGGNMWIRVLRGAIVLERIGDNITSYAHWGELWEPQRRLSRIQAYLPLMFNSVVAFSQNQPLPEGDPGVSD